MISFPPHLEWVVWAFLAVVAVLGLVALVSPRRFAALAQRGSKWIDTSRVVEAMDRRVDVDQHIIRHSRVFGVLVIVAALVLASLFYATVLGRPPLF